MWVHTHSHNTLILLSCINEIWYGRSLLYGVCACVRLTSSSKLWTVNCEYRLRSGLTYERHTHGSLNEASWRQSMNGNDERTNESMNEWESQTTRTHTTYVRCWYERDGYDITKWQQQQQQQDHFRKGNHLSLFGSVLSYIGWMTS